MGNVRFEGFCSKTGPWVLMFKRLGLGVTLIRNSKGANMFANSKDILAVFELELSPKI